MLHAGSLSARRAAARPRAPLPRPPGLLTLLGLLGACDAAELGAALDLQCASAADCKDEQRCDFGHCVAPGPNRAVVQARIIPPANSDLLPQQLPALTFAAGPDWLIRLLEPVTLRGVVTPAGDSFTVNVPGELEVTTPGEIDGLDYRFTARVTDGVDQNGDGYALRVLPGRRYAGTFRADDKSLPPFAFTLTAEDVATGRFDVTLPRPADYVTLGGRLRHDDYTPVAGARIVALLPDDAVVGVTTSEPQRGLFSLTLPPGVTEVRLKVSAPSDGVVFPDFTTSPLAPATDVDLIVPALPAGTAVFSASLHVVAKDAYGVLQRPAGLTVTIVGDLAGGTLRRTATTDADGVETLDALPGAYECLVSTGPDSPWASWHGRVTLADYTTDALSAPVTLELAYRSPLFGAVSDASGVPLAAGTVYAMRRVDRAQGDVLAIAPPPFKAVIADGRYQLLVDPGVYDLRVAPDPATGAPPTTLRGVTVHGLYDLPIELPEPALAHLTVARPDGTYMSDVSVELYLSDPETGAPVLLTKGVTNDTGFIDLLIPFIP